MRGLTPLRTVAETNYPRGGWHIAKSGFWRDIGGWGYAYELSNEATKWTETFPKKRLSEQM